MPFWGGGGNAPQAFSSVLPITGAKTIQGLPASATPVENDAMGIACIVDGSMFLRGSPAESSEVQNTTIWEVTLTPQDTGSATSAGLGVVIKWVADPAPVNIVSATISASATGYGYYGGADSPNLIIEDIKPFTDDDILYSWPIDLDGFQSSARLQIVITVVLNEDVGGGIAFAELVSAFVSTTV